MKINTDTKTDENEPKTLAGRAGLKVIEGGRGGGQNDWLKRLPPGTYFLSRPRRNNDGSSYQGFPVVTFYAAGWCGKARIVVQEDIDGNQSTVLVDTERFSSIMELFDVLKDYEENKEEQQEDNSDDGRSDLPRPE